MYIYKTYYIYVLYLIIFLIGCKEAPSNLGIKNEYGLSESPNYCTPQIYSVNKLISPPNIDGVILKDEWDKVPWSSSFVSEIKNGNNNPSHNTKFKLGIINDSLYVSAIVFDKHICATNDICQSYFFDDNFLEFFIDVDEDEYDYVVIKINAFGNLCGEYRQRNHNEPLRRFSWLEICGAKCSVFVDGTINNPKDTDNYWSIECALPMNQKLDTLTLLKPKDIWNVNVQRTYWPSTVVSGLYKKILNPKTGKKYPGEKWLWSFLEENDINTPELWGEWHFNTLNKTNKRDHQLQFERQVKWELRNIYYAQKFHLKLHRKYARKTAALKNVGLKPNKLLYNPTIKAKADKYKAFIFDSSTRTRFYINQDGKVWKEKH